MNFRFNKITSSNIERSAINLRKRNKSTLTTISIGILFHLICIVTYILIICAILSKTTSKQYVVYANEVIVSTIETTITTTTTTTLATTTTSSTTYTTATTEEETTFTTVTTETIAEYALVDEFRLPGWDGAVLTSTDGRIQGPSGQETYYNLPMEGIVSWMRDLGFDEENYPYWIREDGVKMLGDYVMCAADLDLRPRGSFVDSSLGVAIVCDTGEFAYSNPEQLDIATDW